MIWDEQAIRWVSEAIIHQAKCSCGWEGPQRRARLLADTDLRDHDGMCRLPSPAR